MPLVGEQSLFSLGKQAARGQCCPFLTVVIYPSVIIWNRSLKVQDLYPRGEGGANRTQWKLVPPIRGENSPPQPPSNLGDKFTCSECASYDQLSYWLPLVSVCGFCEVNGDAHPFCLGSREVTSSAFLSCPSAEGSSPCPAWGMQVWCALPPPGREDQVCIS